MGLQAVALDQELAGLGGAGLEGWFHRGTDLSR
jgi:hypothetical protein